MKSLSSISSLPTIDEFMYSKVLYHYKVLSNVFEENEGEYPGLKELSFYLAKKLFFSEEKKFIFNKSDLSQFQNLFYDKLIIQFSDRDDAEYQEYKTEYDKSTKSVKVIYINLASFLQDDYELLHQTIIHEMMHAWDDYQEYANGHIGFKDLYNAESPYYKSIDYESYKNSVERYIKEFTYITTKTEANAFTASLNALVKDKTWFKNIRDAFDCFNNLRIYKRYIFYFTMMENFKYKHDSNTEVMKKTWCDKYREFYKINKSNENIINDCYKAIRYAIDKLCSTISTIYYNQKAHHKPFADFLPESIGCYMCALVYMSDEASEFYEKYGYTKFK